MSPGVHSCGVRPGTRFSTTSIAFTQPTDKRRKIVVDRSPQPALLTALRSITLAWLGDRDQQWRPDASIACSIEPMNRRKGFVGRKKKEPDLSTYSGRVAARLRALREGKRLSPEDMVDRLGERGIRLTITSYYRYESGTHSLPLDYLPDVAHVFGMTVRAFLPPE